MVITGAPHGVGVGDAGGVPLGVGVGVNVAVAVAVGVDVAVGVKVAVGVGVGVGLLIVNLRFWVPVPLAFVALKPIVYVPAVVGVPEIKPVVLRLSPAGNGAAPHPPGGITWSAVI